MIASPNKKPHRYRLRGGAFPGQSGRQELPRVKGTVTQNKGGDDGSKYTKRHLLAYGRPGTPNGTCIQVTELQKKPENRELCRCGGHNSKRGGKT